MDTKISERKKIVKYSFILFVESIVFLYFYISFQNLIQKNIDGSGYHLLLSILAIFSLYSSLSSLFFSGYVNSFFFFGLSSKKNNKIIEKTFNPLIFIPGFNIQIFFNQDKFFLNSLIFSLKSAIGLMFLPFTFLYYIILILKSK